MIKKIDITNGYGETLSLDLFQPELSGFAVREISGLGPVQATVSMADYASKPGGRFQGSRLGTREISFDLVFLDSLASIEQVRHQSYQYFPIGEKIEMTFTTDERTVTTTGYVENNEPAIWDSEFEGATIDIVCESPFLRGKDMIVKNLASSYKSFHFPSGSLKEPELLFGYIKVGSDIQITNSGEQECGCIFNIIALEDFSNPLIYNDLDGTYFGLMINVDEGDTVVVNTRVGEKSAKLIRNGQEYNVINYLKTGSTWFQLKRGKNQFSIGQADTYTKAQSGNTVTINADRKNYELNDIRMVLPMSQKNANKASSTKPKDIKVPTGFNLSATKTFWSDEDTDTEKYDVNSKSISFSYSLNDLFSHAIDENGNAATNRAPLAFGAGYLQISYDKENEEDDSEEEKQMGQPKLVMTHVKIPYYTTNKRISPSWTFSNTYNKGVKYTYAKMKLSSCAFTYDGSQDDVAVYNKAITLDTDMPTSPYINDREWSVRPCYRVNTTDIGSGYTFSLSDQFEITVGGETWNQGHSNHSFALAIADNGLSAIILFYSSDGIASGTQINIKVTKEQGTGLTSRLNITTSKLKANSVIYSNRFVYHPEFNTAATTKELSYYFPDMSGQSKCVSYWDNKGRLVLVEFKKGNYTNVKAKIKKLKNGKKKVIKKAVKKAKFSPGYKHWKYSTAKTWLKANPTYVIVELKNPIEYIIDEKMGVADVDDSSNLQQMLYDILQNYPFAIDDKIILTANPYNSETVQAYLETSYTKTIPGRYQYYNGAALSSIALDGCYPLPLLWLRIALPYSSTPYASVTINVNGEDKVIEIGTDAGFYGGYVDVTNGSLISTVNSSGETLEEEAEDEDTIDPLEIELEDGENTLIASCLIGSSTTPVSVNIDRLIYPVYDGTILDRMNLKIEHDNYYVGI